MVDEETSDFSNFLRNVNVLSITKAVGLLMEKKKFVRLARNPGLEE